MLIMKDLYTGEPLEFENSSTLKEFLKMQNPTALVYYKQIAESSKPIKIYGSGESIVIKAKE